MILVEAAPRRCWTIGRLIEANKGILAHDKRATTQRKEGSNWINRQRGAFLKVDINTLIGSRDFQEDTMESTTAVMPPIQKIQAGSYASEHCTLTQVYEKEKL